MLRQRLGDGPFFAGIALYLDRHRHATAITSDFRKAMEDATGDSLEQFFHQWGERPGVPILRVTPTWDAGILSIAVEQLQDINPDNPAFEFDLPVWIGQPGGGVRAIVPVRGRTASASFPMRQAPDYIAADSDLAVLADTSVVQDGAHHIAQLQKGPTLAARIQAARAIGAGEGDTRALSRIAWSKSEHRSLRIECINALEKRNTLGDTFAALDDDPFIREATVDAIARQAERDANLRASVLPAFAGIAGYIPPDGTIRERCAAIRALGRLKAEEHRQVLIDALEVESQHDSVRQSALDALGQIPGEESLRAVLPRVSPASHSRTRPGAISAVAKLAPADPDLAFNTIAPLLNDRDRRTWRAAGQALVDLGDARGIDALAAYRASTADPTDHAQVDQWLQALRTKLQP